MKFDTEWIDKWVTKERKDPLLLTAPYIYKVPSDFYNEYQGEWFDKENKTKPYIIDYANNLEPRKHDDDCLEIMDDLMRKLSAQLAVPQSLLNPSTPNATVTNLSESIVSKHPILYTSYTEYNPDSTIGLPPVHLINWQSALKYIDEFSTIEIPVFIAQSKDVRNSDGDICDPWGRSMSSYKGNFLAKPMLRKETEITSSHSNEILLWVVETSVEGKRVGVILWEKVQMSFVRKSTKDAFLESLHPHRNNKTPVYDM
jgi:hypothetical protein